MIAAHKPMTDKQLREVVAQYASALPGWTLFQEIALVRQSGPIQQMIWFQKMNYAAYRPSHVVKALPISMPRMLAQHLDIRNREIKYASHASQMVNVVSAMELQFMPSI